MSSSTLDTIAVFATIMAGALTWFASTSNAMDPAAAVTNPQPVSVAAFSPMSCPQARAMIEQKGYSITKTIDCGGIQYRFDTVRKNTRYIVLINAQSAGYVAIPR